MTRSCRNECNRHIFWEGREILGGGVCTNEHARINSRWKRISDEKAKGRRMEVIQKQRAICRGYLNE
jgi:hypothetical protein